LMLATKKELVQMKKAVREYPEKPTLYGKTTISLGDLSKSGVYGDASLATEEKGEQMIELFAEKMTALLLEGYGYLTK
ncbi:creatininase family protein, partial [Listeria monocytogenes]|nr:creatininase family protein [Listeria monocytogenes]